MWEFQLCNIDDLKRLNDKLNLSVKAQEDISILAKPVLTGKLTIPNSLAIHPMEGCDGAGFGCDIFPLDSPIWGEKPSKDGKGGESV